ncbi:MAG: excinuclease ABC subunit UvrC [Lachnospiraceae bacterium]|nr:excinuclease ABC subunit UvrC [Lachnospiraceae bacterium]
MFDIQEELKKLPDKPGVYLMHDKNDEIIYVGKAIVLKNRVRQYFQSSRNQTAKIRKMVSQIAYFEYIITGSELEALVLECNLIKEHRPKYNTMLKDDKNYPYIKVTVNEEYPRVLFARTMKRDKAKYYGPYTSAGAVKDTIELVRKIYKIRCCNRRLPKDIGKERPCLYYHMNQCKAPCQGYISGEEYKDSIKKAIDFLKGNYKDVVLKLEEKMMDAASQMEFEQAAEYRDLIASVKQISEKQNINQSDMEDQDVIGLAKAKEEAVAAVFSIRNGKLLGREHYHMTGVEDSTMEEIMTAFVKQLYSGTPFLPREIILQYPIEEEEIIQKWLSEKKGRKVTIAVPKKGKRHNLMELAYKNASAVLIQDSERIRREEKKTMGAMRELSELLGIPEIHRLEAFDISNTNGFENVASMVVFEDGRKKPRDYRKFKMKTVNGPDDYRSMEEVLTRRFLHGQRVLSERGGEKDEYDSFTKFPDVIMMDGGKGQVNVALKVLEDLHLSIPVCGMVKDDNHRTRGLYYNNEEILFPRGSEAFHMITRLQDEAHRFAIEYHKNLRGKTQIRSVLDEIKGVGPERRKALMRHFKDIQKIKEASVEELTQVDSITEKVAEEIYGFFHES